MAKEKTTITLDRGKADEAQRLTGAPSTSATVDVALDRLIAMERLRNDIAAYTSVPPTDAELSLTAVQPGWADLADDTDWESVFAEHDD